MASIHPNRSIKPLIWVRKGLCPSCQVKQRVLHKPNCTFTYDTPLLKLDNDTPSSLNDIASLVRGIENTMTAGIDLLTGERINQEQKPIDEVEPVNIPDYQI